MKAAVILFYLLVFKINFVHSADTTWLNATWKRCEKQHAVYFQINDQQDSLYRRRIYYNSNGSIYQEDFFSDRDHSLKNGLQKIYTAEGQLIDSTRYFNNRIASIHTFYPNGNKKSIAGFSGPGYTSNSYANSWKEDGMIAISDSFYHDLGFMLCHRDTASIIEYVEQKENGWLVTFKFIKQNIPISRAFFLDRNFQQLKYTVWVSPKNKLKDSVIYRNDKHLQNIFQFHSNGQPAAILEFNEKHRLNKSAYWNEDGKPVKKPTGLTNAEPAEGFKSWQRKILKKINSDVRIPWDSRENLYGSVFISFSIDENGDQQEVFIQQTSPYPEMDNMILEYCKENIPWKPAVYFGRRESFKGTHSFSFVKGKVIKYSTLY